MKIYLNIVDVAAIWPLYIDGAGNHSTVLTTRGESSSVARGSMMLVRKMLGNEGMELGLYRRAAGEFSNRKLAIPIVVRDFVYMTFKARHARVRGDEVYGYVRLDMIEAVRNVNGCGRIELVNGVHLTAKEKLETVENHMKEAAYFKMQWHKKFPRTHSDIACHTQGFASIEAQAAHEQAVAYSVASSIASATAHRTTHAVANPIGQPYVKAIIDMPARAEGLCLPCMCESLRLERCPVMRR